jgi:Icc-related predicted phosphoesterase
MKVVAISDIHMDFNSHYIMPDSDLLVVAGDATYLGKQEELYKFFDWLGSQKATHKIFVPGNHDFGCQKDEHYYKMRAKDCGIIMECNGFVRVENKMLFCTAWTPYFYDWAFNGTDEEKGDHMGPNLAGLWRPAFTSEIDLMISHGPPRGILDKNNKGEHCGSQILRKLFDQNKAIRNAVFGHIHHSHGRVKIDNTNFFNVSLLDDKYVKTFLPTEFEI